MSETRVRLVCLMLLGMTILTYGWLLLTARGTLDGFGRPIGTDFSDVYAAGWLADHGRAAAAWLWPEHYGAQQQLHRSTAVPFYGWHYPPPFLLLASLLAFLPYFGALLVWQGATLALTTGFARAILPARGTVLAMLSAPACFICLGHGQNGFLTASLLCGGLWLLERRPLVAGLMLGGLVYKPQFAVLLPVVLIVLGNKRALSGAAASSLSLIGLTLGLWGWPVWKAFHDSLPGTQHIVIEMGGPGWEKIVTLFAAARSFGAPLPLAYSLQTLSSAVALIGAALVTRGSSPAIRGAAVACAALLSTPYALDYDLVIAGGAILFLVADARARGWLAYEKSLLVFAYLAPLAGRQIASSTLLPIDWLTVVGLFVLALRRAWILDREALPILRSSPFRRLRAAFAR